MLEKGKVSTGEFLVSVIIFTIGATILVAPGPLAAVAKQDAWISSALATIISLVFVSLFNQLASLYPSMTYVEQNEEILGKWLGKIAALFFLFYLFVLSSSLLADLGFFLTTYILVGTPIEVIMSLFLVTSLIAVRQGIEVIFRSVIIFFPWIVTVLVILIVFLLPEAKLENIQPIMGGGIKPIMKGAYHNVALPYVQLVVFLMVAPFVAEKAKMKKALYSGIIGGGSILFIVVFLAISVLGADSSARLAYPTYTLGKNISVGNFIERIEVIVAFIWILSIYFKLTICYYGLSLGLAQVLKLKTYRILLFPLAFILLPYTIYSNPNIVYHQFFLNVPWTPFCLTICFIFPLILFIIGKFRKGMKRGK